MQKRPTPIYQPRCRVCKSPFRVEVEKALIEGKLNFSAIARAVPANIEGERVTRRSIRNHYDKHLSPSLMQAEARIAVQAVEDELWRAISDSRHERSGASR